MVATTTAHHILYYIGGSLSLVYYQVQQEAFQKAADIYQQDRQMRAVVVAPEALLEIHAEAAAMPGHTRPLRL